MKMKRIMKSTRGEGYIDLAVAVLVLVFVFPNTEESMLVRSSALILSRLLFVI